eukprot:2031528-Rhodomonas_salina.1
MDPAYYVPESMTVWNVGSRTWSIDMRRADGSTCSVSGPLCVSNDAVFRTLSDLFFYIAFTPPPSWAAF